MSIYNKAEIVSVDEKRLNRSFFVFSWAFFYVWYMLTSFKMVTPFFEVSRLHEFNMNDKEKPSGRNGLRVIN